MEMQPIFFVCRHEETAQCVLAETLKRDQRVLEEIMA